MVQKKKQEQKAKQSKLENDRWVFANLKLIIFSLLDGKYHPKNMGQHGPLFSL